jgi:hypothetical protein
MVMVALALHGQRDEGPDITHRPEIGQHSAHRIPLQCPVNEQRTAKFCRSSRRFASTGLHSSFAPARALSLLVMLAPVLLGLALVASGVAWMVGAAAVLLRLQQLNQ